MDAEEKSIGSKADSKWLSVPDAITLIRKSESPTLSSGKARNAFMAAMRTRRISWRSKRSRSVAEGRGNFWERSWIEAGERVLHIWTDEQGRRRALHMIDVEINKSEFLRWMNEASQARLGRLSSGRNIKAANLDEIRNIVRRYQSLKLAPGQYKANVNVTIDLVRQRLKEDSLTATKGLIRDIICEIPERKWGRRKPGGRAGQLVDLDGVILSSRSRTSRRPRLSGLQAP